MVSYTVWVGGVPVVEYVEYSTALTVYESYIYQGYEDTIIEEHK